ncbi:MAG: hypothetical protein MJZ98_00750 [Paludibacteraceae bacterium]|nr:hypothetical protein [Paludibacteraceae bacterium]
MPYRRLPKTDQARLRTLRSITELEYQFKIADLPVQLKTMSAATQLLSYFTDAVQQYQQAYDLMVEASKKHQQQVATARLYVSHFIQVLNMTVARGELKRDLKALYGLDPNSNLLPDLSNEQQLMEWGEKVLRGEQERIAKGGMPQQNPSAARTKVHYDVFIDRMRQLNEKQQTFTAAQSRVQELRPQVDELIHECWDNIEARFADLPLEERVARCQRCGIIYYYRKGEKPLSA